MGQRPPQGQSVQGTAAGPGNPRTQGNGGGGGGPQSQIWFGGTGSWSTVANWSLGLPVWAGSCTIITGTCNLNSTVGQIGDIIVGDATLTVSASNTSGQVSTVDGTVQVTGGTFSTAQISVTGDGVLAVTGGTLSTRNNASVIAAGRQPLGGSPTVSFTGGTVNLGTGTVQGDSHTTLFLSTQAGAGGGTVTVTGNFNMQGPVQVNRNSGTTITGNFTCSGPITFQCDQAGCGSLTVNGNVSLGSGIANIPTPDFLSVGGAMPDEYQIISATGTIGCQSGLVSINGKNYYCRGIPGSVFWSRPGNVKGSITKGGTGQAGIAITVIDSLGNQFFASTDGSGNFSVFTDADDTTWLACPGACQWSFVPPMGAVILGPPGDPPWSFTLNAHQDKSLTGSYAGP